MLIRGHNQDLQANRAGQLSADQAKHLRTLRPFRLAIIPSIVVGVALMLYGASRAEVVGWIIFGLGIFMALSGWLRYKQRASLERGKVRSFIGLLEKIKSSPLHMFEAEVMIDGTAYVVLNQGDQQPQLEPGQRYRYFVIDGLARMGIIVGIELP